jgi:hypothetical protein
MARLFKQALLANCGLHSRNGRRWAAGIALARLGISYFLDVRRLGMRKLVSVFLLFAALSSGTAAAAEVVCGTGVVTRIGHRPGTYIVLGFTTQNQPAASSAYFSWGGVQWLNMDLDGDPQRWSYFERDLQLAFALQIPVRIKNSTGVCYGRAQDFDILLCNVESDCKSTD